jgi:hypothetical protein
LRHLDQQTIQNYKDYTTINKEKLKLKCSLKKYRIWIKLHNMVLRLAQGVISGVLIGAIEEVW